MAQSHHALSGVFLMPIFHIQPGEVFYRDRYHKSAMERAVCMTTYKIHSGKKRNFVPCKPFLDYLIEPVCIYLYELCLVSLPGCNALIWPTKSALYLHSFYALSTVYVLIKSVRLKHWHPGSRHHSPPRHSLIIIFYQ